MVKQLQHLYVWPNIVSRDTAIRNLKFGSTRNNILKNRILNSSDLTKQLTQLQKENDVLKDRLNNISFDENNNPRTGSMRFGRVSSVGDSGSIISPNNNNNNSNKKSVAQLEKYSAITSKNRWINGGKINYYQD